VTPLVIANNFWAAIRLPYHVYGRVVLCTFFCEGDNKKQMQENNAYFKPRYGGGVPSGLVYMGRGHLSFTGAIDMLQEHIAPIIRPINRLLIVVPTS
jgi:hypothetical protein